MEEVYRQAMEAAWGVRTHATPTDSAQSSHTAAIAEDGQEVSQGHFSLAHLHCLVQSFAFLAHDCMLLHRVRVSRSKATALLASKVAP